MEYIMAAAWAISNGFINLVVLPIYAIISLIIG